MNDVTRMFATAPYDPLVGFPLLAAAVLVAIAWTSDVAPGWREPSDGRRWTALVATVVAAWGVGRVTELLTLFAFGDHPATTVVTSVATSLPFALLALAGRPTLVTVATLALLLVAPPNESTDAAAWGAVVAWATTSWWARGVRPRLTRAGASIALLVGTALAHLTWGTALAATRGMEPTLAALLTHAAQGPWLSTVVLAALVALPAPAVWTLAAAERHGPVTRRDDAIIGPVAPTHARVPRAVRTEVDRPLLPAALEGTGHPQRRSRSFPVPSIEAMQRRSDERHRTV